MKLYLLLLGLTLGCRTHTPIKPCFNEFIHHYKSQKLSQNINIEISSKNTIAESYVRQFLESEYDPNRFQYLYGIVDTLYDNIIITLSLRINDNDAIVDPQIDPPQNVDPDYGLSEIAITTYNFSGNIIDQILVGKWVDGYSPSYCSQWEINGVEIHDLTIGPFTTLPTTTTAVSYQYEIESDGKFRLKDQVRENIRFTETDFNNFLGI